MDIDYRLLTGPRTRLGSGEFGRVFETEYDGKKIVMKIMKHAISPDFFLNEIDILKCLNHPNIPHLIGFSSGAKNNLRCILYEKAEGIDLFQYIRYCDIDPKKKKEISCQIISTLAYIHSKNILYRDLKPENIIINMKMVQIKFIDFGLSCRTTLPIKGIAGTPGYIAPEVLRDEYYYQEADVYSFGMTMFVLWTERNPLKNSLMFYYIRSLPTNIRKIILSCVNTDPLDRPSPDEILLLLSKKPGFRERFCACLLWE